MKPVLPNGARSATLGPDGGTSLRCPPVGSAKATRCWGPLSISRGAYSIKVLKGVVYLHIADKYHRLTRPTVVWTKRHSREGSPVIPAALSPLVTPSTPAVWTHVACSG